MNELKAARWKLKRLYFIPFHLMLVQELMQAFVALPNFWKTEKIK